MTTSQQRFAAAPPAARVSDGSGQARKETPLLHPRITGGAENNPVFDSERAQSGAASIFPQKKKAELIWERSGVDLVQG